MVNLRARQYEPAQMRFSQPDIVRGYAIAPQTVNRYAYCASNPVMYADPSGESYTSGVGVAWSRTASILIDDYVQVAPSTVNRLVGAAKQTVGNGGASASERRIKASIKAAQEEIRRLNVYRRTYDLERELIGRRACAQLLGDETRAAEYEAELEFVQAHTYQDILFLVGIDYLGVELSMENRLSILERLKANDGSLTGDDLVEFGIYTEETRYVGWRMFRGDAAADIAALLEASYCGSRFEQTLYSIDQLHRADRQAEVQMFLRFFGNMAIMASVQDYNAAGSAIREPGATVATKGYESGPGDGTSFKYEGTKYSWYNADGSMNYPPNNGAVPGTEVKTTLVPGQMLGRYGDPTGKSHFLTVAGADPHTLALPPNTDPSKYHTYEVLREIPDTVQSVISDWGGSNGGGLQYDIPLPILWLLDNGYLIER